MHPRRLRLWIQAASVGEVQSLQSLIERLYETVPVDIYLTTTSSTGFRVAKEMYGNVVGCIAYFPLNFWWFSVLAWNRIQPTVVWLTDSEFWPEHLHQAKIRGVPLFLVNGRCSDRSFARYRRCKGLTRWIFPHFDRIWLSDEETFGRFVELGADEERLSVTGNLKLDNLSAQRVPSEQEILSLRESVTGHRDSRVLLGASTWPGEEEMLLKTYLRAKSEGIDVRLVLAPRHGERRKDIEMLLSAYRLPYCLHSQEPRESDEMAVYVLDVVGELRRFTRMADVVFVGKSLPPHRGGQNPIEAAAYGKAIVYGPNMGNFRTICRDLETFPGALPVSSEEEAEATLLRLLKEPEECKRLGNGAKRWHVLRGGALDRLWKEVFPLLTNIHRGMRWRMRREEKEARD
jgi:3-deoxy-D-manno-octulosonic-acid transferase